LLNRPRGRAFIAALPILAAVTFVLGVGAWISQTGAPDDSGGPLALSAMLLLSPLIPVGALASWLLARVLRISGGGRDRTGT